MVNALISIPESFVMALQLLLTGAMYIPGLRQRRLFIVRSCLGVTMFFFLSWISLGLHEDQDLLIHPLLIYALFGVLLLILFDLDGKKLCFVFLAAVATQHMAVTATDTLRAVFQTYDRNVLWYAISFLCFAVTLPTCYRIFGRQMRYTAQVKMQSARLIIVSCIIFALVYLLRVFSLIQMWKLPQGNPLFITVNLYGLVGSLAALTILFTGNHEDTLVEENQMIEQMLHEREAQELLTGETIDLVNMKYHDMKHLVTAMRHTGGAGVGDVLDEIERVLPQYERVLHTGNAALDTVLMNKLVLCGAKDITLNCMADGAKLEMLSSADIYALFGNLLDNAIDALQEEPVEKRAISLQVFEKRGYLCIHAENSCSNPPDLENGIPKTRKRDKQYHGFGIRSICYIAEKYGGNVTISAEDRQFNVDILIPVS